MTQTRSTASPKHRRRRDDTVDKTKARLSVFHRILVSPDIGSRSYLDSNSQGTLLDTSRYQYLSTFQICRIEEKITRTTTFHK